MRRTGGNRGIVTPPGGPGSGASGLGLGDLGSEEGNRLQRAAWGEDSVEAVGSTATGSADRSGLEAAKAQWKAMGAKRNRLRRTLSQETSPIAGSSSRLGPSVEGGSTAAVEDSQTPTVGASGHPIAMAEGLPIPELRTLAPLPRLPAGGVSTFQAEMQVQPVASSSVVASSTSGELQQGENVPRSHQPVRLAATASSSSFAEGIQSISLQGGDVPDFAAGRGGDGIGGVDMPSETSKAIEREAMDLDVRERENQQEEMRAQRVEMAKRMSGILKW